MTIHPLSCRGASSMERVSDGSVSTNCKVRDMDRSRCVVTERGAGRKARSRGRLPMRAMRCLIDQEEGSSPLTLQSRIPRLTFPSLRPGTLFTNHPPDRGPSICVRALDRPLGRSLDRAGASSMPIGVSVSDRGMWIRTARGFAWSRKARVTEECGAGSKTRQTSRPCSAARGSLTFSRICACDQPLGSNPLTEMSRMPFRTCLFLAHARFTSQPGRALPRWVGASSRSNGHRVGVHVTGRIARIDRPGPIGGPHGGVPLARNMATRIAPYSQQVISIRVWALYV